MQYTCTSEVLYVCRYIQYIYIICAKIIGFPITIPPYIPSSNTLYFSTLCVIKIEGFHCTPIALLSSTEGSWNISVLFD